MKNDDEGDLREWRDLIRRRAANADSALDDDMTFLGLPTPKQQAVIRRLRVLNEYLELSEPTADRADEAAAKLGVARRTFYHLLGKMREHGAVRGLSPGYRIKQRPSVAKDGMGEVPERTIAEILDADPEAPLGQVYRAVSEACRLEGKTAPKEAEVRLRLHELRRSGRSSTVQATSVGRSLLVDQSPVDLIILSGDRQMQAIVTVVVDRPTKLVLGTGVATANSGSDGLRSAIRNAVMNVIPSLIAKKVSFADRVEEIELVVPPGLEGCGEKWRASSSASESYLKLTVVDHGPKRHGFALVRLMGDKLGIYSFKTRSPLDPESPPAWQISHQPEDALAVIRYAAEAWNRPILKKLEVSASENSFGAATKRGAICAQLTALFEPFFEIASGGANDR